MSMARSFVFAALLLLPEVSVDALRSRHVRGGTARWRIKMYYINLDSSAERHECMKDQLDGLAKKGGMYGLDIQAERVSAVSFSDKCQDAATCMADQPSCFPSKKGFASHGNDQQNATEIMPMIHGVFGDACSHLKVLEKMRGEIDWFDYFFVLEDDVGISEGILDNLAKLFEHFPDHWSMITIDSFPWPERPTPICDEVPELTRKGLALTGVSPTKSTYWGSQAWLISSDKVPLFLNFYRTVPLMNADWYTKVSRPLHLGIWSFTPGQMRQMRMVSDDFMMGLPGPCGGRGLVESDIAEMVFTRSAEAANLNVKVESSSPRELLILGMKGAGADWVQDLVHETIEKPQGVALCDTSAGNACGGVPTQLPPGQWGEELSKYRRPDARSLSEAVAVVVVRHPFAVAEEMNSEGADQSSFCSGHGCDADCATDAWSGGVWSGVPCQWSAYVKSLGAITGNGPFHKILILRFEDVFEFPNMAISKIAKAVSLAMPKHVIASHVDRTINRRVGKALLLNDLTYKTESRCNQLAHMCANADKGGVWKYGYHGCQSFYSFYSDTISESVGEELPYFSNCTAFEDKL